MNSPERTPADRWPLLAGVLLVALSFAVYQPALRGGFIWDDDIYLTGNRLIHAADGVSRFWFTSEAMDYYPLSSTVLWLEWRWWGERVTGYRFVNLLLHALSGILLWRILRRWQPALAWPAAALFVVHPLNVEAVAWIAQMKTVLATTCALGSVLWWLRAEEGGRGALAVSWLLFLASLLSKTVAVALPAVLLLLAWARPGRLTKRAVLASLPFWAAALALGLVTTWFQRHHAIAHFDVRPESFLSKVAGTGWAAWFYALRTFVPYPLAICHPRWTIDPEQGGAWVPLLAGLAALAFVALRVRRWGRWPLALVLVYLALLAPVLGLLDIGFMLYALVADHWQYVAMPALLGLLVAAGGRLGERRRPALAVVAGLLGAGCLLVSRHHAGVFSDEFRLWRHNVAVYPQVWMGHLGLANALFGAGQAEEALQHYQKTLELNPRNASAHGNLGALYAMHNNAGQAERHLRESARLDPHNPNTLFNLARVCENLEHWGEAVTNYQAALRWRPDDLGILFNLGGLLLRVPEPDLRRPRQALDLAARAAELTQRSNLHVLELLARCHQAAGDGATAGQVAREAAALAATHGLAEERDRFIALAAELTRPPVGP